MRTLILQLPASLPGPTLAYAHAVVQTDATAPQTPAVQVVWAQASLLPAADRRTEVVVVVPAPALSWHRVELPAGLHKQPARLQAALAGVLEDRLLDDPASLHMALQPDWKNAMQPWVAVCDRAWLTAHLQALESTGLTVHRIVPEFAPTSPGLLVTALGDTATGWLWLQQAERGVWGLPIHDLTALTSQGESLWPEGEDPGTTDVQAEPAVVALVSDKLQRPARLMAPSTHWLAALASGWDLAQFDLRANAQTRALKSWQRAASSLWHSSNWRPARWGLGLLLASQMLGLNAWAIKTRADWLAQQNAWTQVLRETFPQVQVVVDAPLQMAREVARLRQNAGQLTPADFESMLSALGQAWPAGVASPRQISYQPGLLRLPDLKLNDGEQQAVQTALEPLGYRWLMEGTAAVVQIKEAQP